LGLLGHAGFPTATRDFAIQDKGINSLPGLANRAIIVSIKAFPGIACGVLRALHEKWEAVLGRNLPRWLMLTAVMVVFGIFAIGLIILLIYKSTLTMHEDDQLFLDEANSHMQEEQTELLTKVNRLTIPVRVFSIGSGVFLLVLVAMLIYQKLNEMQ
jgi:multisubunit Na+/H+ antiporter MnhB subunit